MFLAPLHLYTVNVAFLKRLATTRGADNMLAAARVESEKQLLYRRMSNCAGIGSDFSCRAKSYESIHEFTCRYDSVTRPTRG